MPQSDRIRPIAIVFLLCIGLVVVGSLLFGLGMPDPKGGTFLGVPEWFNTLGAALFVLGLVIFLATVTVMTLRKDS